MVMVHTVRLYYRYLFGDLPILKILGNFEPQLHNTLPRLSFRYTINLNIVSSGKKHKCPNRYLVHAMLNSRMPCCVAGSCLV